MLFFLSLVDRNRTTPHHTTPHHTTQKVMMAVQYIHKELPIRLARAIQLFYHLPYIAGVNPYMIEVLLTYLLTFEKLRVSPPVKSYEDVTSYLEMVANLTVIHQSIFKTLALGIAEVKLQPSLGIDDAELVCTLETAIHPPTIHSTRLRTQDAFMDDFVKARLSRRVLVAHPVKLYQAFEASREGRSSDETAYIGDGSVGVFDRRCNPKEVIERSVNLVSAICQERFGRAPEVVFTGDLDSTITYIPDHLGYIFTELLKNSMRHTFKWSIFMGNGKDIPPIRIHICHINDYGAIVKLCDEGGGFSEAAMEHAWQWGGRQKCDGGSLDIPLELSSRQAVTGDNVAALVEKKAAQIMKTIENGPVEVEGNPHFLSDWMMREHESDLGALTTNHTGLPCARTYARYLGGDISIESMEGLGANTYVHLSSVHGEVVRF